MTTSKKCYLILCGLCLFMACAPSRQLENDDSILENTKWILVEYDGKEYNPADDSKRINITLQSESHGVQGFGGCNNFSGSYTHNSNTLQFNLVSTKMFCMDLMDAEDYLYKTLKQVEYTIEDEVLRMKSADGKSLMFKRG